MTVNLQNTTTTLYDVSRESWYSPIKIIDQFELLRQKYGELLTTQSEFKRAREMFSGATALLGAYELSPSNTYWMQLNRQGNSPDVVACKLTETEIGIVLEIVQMEITEFEEHFPSDNIIDFLIRTKLAPTKSYDEHTMIVCMVNRILPIDIDDLCTRLNQIKPKSTIYIMGRQISGEMGGFTFFSPFPSCTKPIDFNVNETSEKYKLHSRIQLNRGTDKKISFKKTKLVPINTYDIFGLDQKLIEKKYPMPH